MTTTDPGALLDEDDRGVLDALAEAAGAAVESAALLSREPSGRGLVSGWRVRLAGEPSDRTVYIETAPRGSARPGVVTLRDDAGDERAAWVFPHDPALPALPAATVPGAAAVLLARLGAELGAGTSAGGAGREPRLELLAYRPGKRAVIRADGGDATRYLKVVPPHRAQAIHDTHAAWRTAGLPVPESLAWSSDGLLVLAELPGPTASSMLATADAVRLANGIADLSARIARIDSSGAARASLADRADWYARQFARLHPDDGERVQEVLAAAGRLREESVPAAAPATVHGDLHLGQLLVDEHDPARITGVLDVDTAGLGDPADDLAATWAHLVATAELHAGAGDSGRADAACRLAELLHARWPAALRTRAAAISAVHLVGHALSGHLDGAVAADLAERLVAAPDESPLTTAS